MSDFCLIKDRHPNGRIFLPVNSSRALIFAVEELNRHLDLICGCTLPLAWRNAKNEDSGIVLEVVPPPGNFAGASQQFQLEMVSGVSSNIDSVKLLSPIDKFFDLPGDNSGDNIDHATGAVKQISVNTNAFEHPNPGGGKVFIRGCSGLGVLYGVYEFLRQLGVRWFVPGEEGVKYPTLNALILSDYAGKSIAPSFYYRCLDVTGLIQDHFDVSDYERYRDDLHYQYDLWLIRNRLHFDREKTHENDWFDFNKVVQSGGGHSLHRKCGINHTSVEAEPERFALVTRDFKQIRTAKNAQICFTNEKNFQTALKNCLAHFRWMRESAGRGERATDLDDISMSIDMSLEDASGICECPECRKISGTDALWRDRLVWYFMNRLARAIRQEVPNGKIMLFAPYYELTEPPADVKLEDNIICIACRSLAWENTAENQMTYPFPSLFKRWVEKTAAAGANMRNYDYVLWQGGIQSLDIIDAAKGYYEMGFRLYHAEVMQRTEQVYPILWVLANYTFDATQNPRQLLRDFCVGSFGEAAGRVVEKLYLDIHARGVNITRRVYGNINDNNHALPDELIEEYRGKFVELRKNLCGNEKLRFKRFSEYMEMQFRLAQTYRSYCDALNSRAAADIADYRNRMADFEQYVREIELEKHISPTALREFRYAATTDFAQIKPRGRQALADEWQWKVELFAGEYPPEKIDNLFALPEIWKFRLDPREVGLAENWQSESCDDRKNWQDMSTYNINSEQGYLNVGGRFWYRLHFTSPKFPDGKRIILRIGSIDDSGEVYLNGVKVGEQPLSKNWDRSFAMDITDFLRQGEKNLIAVRGFKSVGASGIWRPCAIYTE